jgi:apolipoprotein N-acyltransferase
MRCAATGETCVISPLGTIVARLPLHATDVLTAEVPLVETVTLATRFWPAFPAACGLALVTVGLRRRLAARAA